MKTAVTLLAFRLLLLLQQPECCLAAGVSTLPTVSRPDPTSGRRFPFLTRVRDATVEFFFGRHPTKVTEPTPPHSWRSRYTNELVLRFNVTTPEEERALADAASRLFLDIWAFTDEFVDIRLHRDEIVPLLGLLPPSLNAAQSILIPDLAIAVHKSLPSSVYQRAEQGVKGSLFLHSASVTSPDNLFFQDYQSLPVIVRWMRLLEAMFPSFVKFISIGASFEGREIPALRVGVPSTVKSKKPRKTIVVSGGLHAREWISTSTVNYVAWSFITSFGKERMISKLLDDFDIVFIPVMNPDGVEYSWEVDRLWRKSRQQTSLRYCRGLDLDHAFGYEWDGSQIQSDPCSESYGGEEPFQAEEAKQLAMWARNETLNNNVKFVGLIDLHSYSQQILFPYAFSCDTVPPNIENLEELGAGIAKAIRIANGESYSLTSACEGAATATEDSRHGQAASRMESGGGSAIDWFYHELGAHYSYQVKLRDTGSYGFLLPKEYIVPTGEEMFSALKYFGDYLLGNNGIEKYTDDIERSAVNDAAPLEEDDQAPYSHELRRRRLLF